MAVSIAPSVAGAPRQRAIAWAAAAEAAWVAAAIVVVAPLFRPLALEDAGRDGRFDPAVVVVGAMPPPVLPEACAIHAPRADPGLRDRLCGRARVIEARGDRWPRALDTAEALASRALVAPLEDARAGLDALRRQRSEEGADRSALDRGIAGELARIASYARRHGLDPNAPAEPLALGCAVDATRAASAGSARGDAETLASANAVLLIAAAHDAHPAMPALLRSAALPAVGASVTRCEGLDLRRSLASVAALMSEARASTRQRAKDDAMRALLHTAPWQWAGASILGLLLLALPRAGVSPAIGTGVALAAWAGAAYAGRVPLPLASGQTLVFARDGAPFAGVPAGFVVAMLVVAACLLVAAPWLAKGTHGARSSPASIFAYPGFVAATGVGWLVLLDLSANGAAANRYLALYHQGHLWLAMLAFCLAAIWRQPIARGLAWLLALGDGAASRVSAKLGILGAGALFLAIAFVGIAAIAMLLANTRQLTSELGRLWLVTGAAWFFFLRGTPFTERIARRRGTLGSLARYLAPLAFVVIVLVAAMVLTRDMGPLLVAGYGAGAFVAASVAMWWMQRRSAPMAAYAIAVLLFAAWIVAGTAALHRFGALDPVTAARLENVAVPLASANDQLALVTWFQRAAPPLGFGVGAVPWCGFGTPEGCAGVPAQIQSDYTFTALVGVFGWSGAWLLTLASTLWLVGAVRPHGRATRGEPRLVRVGGRFRNDEQAFASWLAVAWVAMTLCQLAVTVAGNLAVIPLTGVTFPFVSFGMTSLTANAAMLAFAVDVTAADKLR